MRKMLLIPLIVCMVLLLFTLSISAVHATPPATAEGTWVYIPGVMTVMRVADGNTFFDVASINIVTGTFDGTGAGVDILVLHSSGFWAEEGLATFGSCTVEGKSGALVIRWGGKATVEGQWSGYWVILSGTGDLANLRGQGRWWGPETPGGNDYPYSGKIHFEPD